MSQVDETIPWLSPDWLEAAERWTRAELERLGVEPLGRLEAVHARPWSAFTRIVTSRGTVYVKVPAPQLRFEARLTEVLAHRHPQIIVRPMAIHQGNGWILSPHVAETLRTRISTLDDLRRWHPILEQYAQLQIDEARHTDELLALGVPDRRLAALPAQFDALLADHESLRLGRPGGLSLDEHRRLQSLRPRLIEACDRLASFGIPESVAHEEIHDANVLLGDDGVPAILDWGDSCVGHPFFSVLVMLRHPAYRLQIEESDPAIRRLLEVYLDPFTAFGPLERMRAAADEAYRLARIVRSLAYQSVLGPLPERFRIEIDNTSGWLQDYLAAAE